ncbi:metalloregulator ArsR/SmtB family transcription factor [Saxibacter everestensis]|uniref:Metalloregulator ArsR/SmtB family transcription factor n=1 Tax=Saxibacter everestensis TaxID=2909229 RepID=A0ABY8QUI8_9MICO|nr:metalloregulator ArsR/SmtB family transcription factor [Brevibacteriaceae bacterium ZFBP1038]
MTNADAIYDASTDNKPASCSAPTCAPITREPLSEQSAQQLAKTLKALADPTRLRLLSIIGAHQGGEVCACDLTGPVGLSQPTVSHHLKILVDAGLISRDKRGVWAYYAVIPDSLEAIAAVLTARRLEPA